MKSGIWLNNRGKTSLIVALFAFLGGLIGFQGPWLMGEVWNAVAQNEKVQHYKKVVNIQISIKERNVLNHANIFINPDRMMVALTFDDGPDPVNTNRILDVLEENNSRATFFVMGYKVDSCQDEIRRAYEMGCQIGNHTYNHPDLTKISGDDVIWQVQHTNELLTEVIGEPAELVRPPYGAVNNQVLNTIGTPAILWSIDTLDWKTKDPEQIVPAVLDNVKDGDIILLHDVHSTTADAVEIIVPALKEMGYQLVTVEELAYYRGYELEEGTRYGAFYNHDNSEQSND